MIFQKKNQKRDEPKDDLEAYLDNHYINRSNWLRAAVLGANDGIISTASIAVGVAAASDQKEYILLATLAGLVAGSLSMAAGEFVSVSSQSDIEKADIKREKEEIEEMPELELERLKQIYIERGLTDTTAAMVAKELTEHDALGAHVRDELGINDIGEAKPVQAALVSGAAFTVGGSLPLVVSIFASPNYLEYILYASSMLFLIILGTFAAKTGGSEIGKAIARITFWGTAAMGLTALVGYWFGVHPG